MELFAKTKGLGLVHMLRKANLYPFFRKLQGSVGNNVTVDGKNLVMMSSNNYLGLTHDRRVQDAAVNAINYWGTGCTGSRFLNGNLELHETLEKKLAEFLGAEATLVFASGFLANLGAIPALAEEGDYIFSDEENHACIIEGCRLSKAKTLVYKHGDMEHLEKLLASVPADSGKLIITDGVFSMTGRVAKYDQIHALAKRYNARTYIDDAHGLGVIGKGGRGTASHFNLPADLIMGTFSKSLASQGGFVAGSKSLIEWLKLRSRSFIFSAALAPASAASALKALEILTESPDLVDKAKANMEYLKRGLNQLGLNTMNSETTIVPVFIGDDATCLGVTQALLKLGIFTTPVVFPGVPKGQALIRCSVMPTHTKQDLDVCLKGFAAMASVIIEGNNMQSKGALADFMDSKEINPAAVVGSLPKFLQAEIINNPSLFS